MEKVQKNTVRYVIATLVALLTMSLFAFVLITVYLPNRVKNVNEDIIKERLAKLAAVNAKQIEAISSYSWVDKEKGIVKIPITEAMKLVVAKPNDIQFTKPAEAQKPAETKKPTEVTKPTEEQKSTKIAKSVETTKPTEVTKSPKEKKTKVETSKAK